MFILTCSAGASSLCLSSAALSGSWLFEGVDLGGAGLGGGNLGGAGFGGRFLTLPECALYKSKSRWYTTQSN